MGRGSTCKTFAEAVNKAGGKAENIVLPEIGIQGNSHMLMQDRNSLVAANWLLAWIDRNIEHRSGKQGAEASMTTLVGPLNPTISAHN
jgi:hypothetical protein